MHETLLWKKKIETIWRYWSESLPLPESPHMGVFPDPSFVICFPHCDHARRSCSQDHLPVSREIKCFPCSSPWGCPFHRLLFTHPPEEVAEVMYQGAPWFTRTPGAWWPHGGTHGNTEALSYWFHVDLGALRGAHPPLGGAVPTGYLVRPSI